MAEPPVPGSSASDPASGSEPAGTSTRARLLLAALLLTAFAGLLAVRVTSWGRLDQTALFYVGLPAVIALLVVLTVRPRSAVGVAVAVTTVALALSGPLLGEGLVCVVMAAPLIYGVVCLVTWQCSLITGGGRGSQHALFAVPLLFALILEGIGGFSLIPTADQGTGGRFVDAAPDRVAAALAVPPEYDAPEAPFLRAVPFPEPVRAAGEGLAVGDIRSVTFTPGRTLAIGADPIPHRMELEVVESDVRADGGRVVFDVVDDTAFARWMDMHRAQAVWSEEDGGTRLTWTIDYDRTYEPSWYFGPLQAYATHLAAEYLADTFGAAAAEDIR